MLRTFAFALAALLLAAPASAATQSTAALKAALVRDVNGYLATRSKIEHLSAISLSVSLKGSSDYINVTAGRTQYGGGGDPIALDNIFQIGSNTKAFTSVAILQLEAEGKLNIDQTIGKWLPQYHAWKNVTIRRLLSMTSGIPSYDNTDSMLAAYAKTPKRHFTVPELIAYVYPGEPKAPKPTTGYSYSNTNYLLAELIVENASGDTFPDQLDKRFFRGAPEPERHLLRTQPVPGRRLARLPAAYFVNSDPDNKPLFPLLGTNVSLDSLSCDARRRWNLGDDARSRALGARSLHRPGAQRPSGAPMEEPRLDEDRKTARQGYAGRTARFRSGRCADDGSRDRHDLVLRRREPRLPHRALLRSGDRRRRYVFVQQSAAVEGRRCGKARVGDLQDAKEGRNLAC